MVIDKERIKEKINHIKKNLEKLKKLSAIPEKDFLKDYRNYDSAKYNLQISIEAMLDICNHIISRLQLRVPRNNADVFRVLNEEGIIPDDKISIYIAMAKFRNRVVHLYEEIDEREIYRILQENLVDFEDFLKVILESINNYRWNIGDGPVCFTLVCYVTKTIRGFPFHGLDERTKTTGVIRWEQDENIKDLDKIILKWKRPKLKWPLFIFIWNINF